MNKVYGFCDAGCRYRVPTYDEFERSASIIKIKPNEDGTYPLEIGKSYRIISTEASGWGNLSIEIDWMSDGESNYNGTGIVELPQEIGSRILTFQPLGFDITTIAYKLNGAYTEVEPEEMNGILYKITVSVKGAGEVYLVNEDAQLKLLNGIAWHKTPPQNGEPVLAVRFKGHYFISGGEYYAGTIDENQVWSIFKQSANSQVKAYEFDMEFDFSNFTVSISPMSIRRIFLRKNNTAWQVTSIEDVGGDATFWSESADEFIETEVFVSQYLY